MFWKRKRNGAQTYPRYSPSCERPAAGCCQRKLFCWSEVQLLLKFESGETHFSLVSVVSSSARHCRLLNQVRKTVCHAKSYVCFVANWNVTRFNLSWSYPYWNFGWFFLFKFDWLVKLFTYAYDYARRTIDTALQVHIQRLIYNSIIFTYLAVWLLHISRALEVQMNGNKFVQCYL